MFDKQLKEKEIKPVEEVVREMRKENQYVASIMPKKGQSLFKYNIQTKVITKVEDFQTEVKMNGSVTKKLIMEKGNLYVAALNKRNAAKKFLIMLAQWLRN